MKFTSNMLTLLLVATSFPATAASYDLQPSEGSRMELTVEKTGLLRGKKHLFSFEKYAGMLQFDPMHPEQSVVELQIESQSIVNHDTWVSMKDLRKIQETALGDMLAAERYPYLRFRSISVNRAEENRYEVRGLLTIREISKPVVVIVTSTAEEGSALALEGTAIVKLTDFGLKPPKALLGTIGTKDEMRFSFKLKAVPNGAPS
jgi:polyisoprenoid-binding protein YceI